ncbi:hypothetical protein HTG_09000 [Natrinema mahii]|nr:hypothetical protein HTG_09000 [Natrinema mahii]
MNSTYNRAQELEESGDLAAASVQYTVAALSKLNETDFEPSTGYRIALSTLLQAISAAARAGNTNRSIAVREIATALITHAINADSDIDPVLKGLYYEWIGDAYLLTDSEHAERYYRKAAAQYEQTSIESYLSWSMEQEFDYIYWTVQSYLDQRDSTFNEELPILDFQSRVKRKRDEVDD